MNYKKNTTGAYNLHVIKTDKFKTAMIKVNFKKKIVKDDVTYRNLLSKVLLESSFNYKTRRELEIKCEDLYNLSISTETHISGNYIITSFSGFFLNEKYTEENMNTESLKFILELILNPNLNNKIFEDFDLGKRLVTDEIKSTTEDPRRYSLIRLLETMNLSYNPIGYLDTLDSITTDNLYNYYIEMLKSDLIDIFIIGEVNEDEVKKQINEYFKINTLKKPATSHFIEHTKIKKRAVSISEILDLNQSKLNLGFRLDKLTDFEKKYVMYVYTFILGGSPDSKLFKNIREKNSLCYNISCSHKPVTNLMIISCGINKDKYKKCLSLIKKEVSKMAKGDFSETDINGAVLTYLSSLKDIEDFEPSIIKLFESHEYLNFDLINERASNIVKVTIQDVINLSKKIHLDTIYLLGGKDETD